MRQEREIASKSVLSGKLVLWATELNPIGDLWEMVVSELT